MPMYEYRCQDCGMIFEARQKFSDPPLDACRGCGGAVSKLISQTGFALRGDGWYKQGYAPTKPEACPAAGNGGGCGSCPKAANE